MVHMTQPDPYASYNQDTLLNSNPVGLVVALYQGAIDSISIAKECLLARDIAGRTKTINKAYNILAELLSSLDHEKGQEISKNLAALYTYMQRRLLDAQLQQTMGPLEEVEKLLAGLLDAWKLASSKYDPFTINSAVTALAALQPKAFDDEGGSMSTSSAYGNYMFNEGDPGGRLAYSF